MTGVNYVIAAYTGPRLSEDPRQVHDRFWFVQTHITRLSQLRHNLKQITIVLTDGGDATANRKIIDLHGTGAPKIVVLTRPNQWFSYGSWEHAFFKFGNMFSHYIFVEDDYVPCFDNFDDVLLEIIDRKKTYVCSLTGWYKTLAAISNSICTYEILSGVLPMPYVKSHNEVPRESEGTHSQHMWSQAFYRKDCLIEDWIDTHASPFWAGKEIRWYGCPRHRPMLVPCHALGREISIVDGAKGRLVATLTIDGDVIPSGTADETLWKDFLLRNAADPCWELPVNPKPEKW